MLQKITAQLQESLIRVEIHLAVGHGHPGVVAALGARPQAGSFRIVSGRHAGGLAITQAVIEERDRGRTVSEIGAGFWRDVLETHRHSIRQCGFGRDDGRNGLCRINGL
ncbi:hypothetical protein D3C87_1330490 [compost metagenome]